MPKPMPTPDTSSGSSASANTCAPSSRARSGSARRRAAAARHPNARGSTCSAASRTPSRASTSTIVPSAITCVLPFAPARIAPSGRNSLKSRWNDCSAAGHAPWSERRRPMPQLTFLFPLSFFTMLALEHFLPGRPQPEIRFWKVKAILFFLVRPVIAIGLPALVAQVLHRGMLLNLSQLPLAADAFLAFLADTLIFYWVHRLMHRVNWIWRWTHQLHHSAERVDVAGFAYVHPLEMVLLVTIGSCVAALLGPSPAASFI